MAREIFRRCWPLRPSDISPPVQIKSQIRNASVAQVLPATGESPLRRAVGIDLQTPHLEFLAKIQQTRPKKLRAGDGGSDGMTRLWRRNAPDRKPRHPDTTSSPRHKPRKTHLLTHRPAGVHVPRSVKRIGGIAGPDFFNQLGLAARAWNGTVNSRFSSLTSLSRLLESIRNLQAQLGY